MPEYRTVQVQEPEADPYRLTVVQRMVFALVDDSQLDNESLCAAAEVLLTESNLVMCNRARKRLGLERQRIAGT
jgi:hypothetical protein